MTTPNATPCCHAFIWKKTVMTDEPRDGEIRAINYVVGETDGGLPIINHRLEQYYSGEWRDIRVYHEDENGTLKRVHND